MKNKGFTLIELMIVIAIIAIIAAIAIPGILSARRAANANAAMGNLKSFSTAMATFSNDQDDQTYPADKNIFGSYYTHLDVKAGYNYAYFATANKNKYVYLSYPVSLNNGTKIFVVDETNHIWEGTAEADIIGVTVKDDDAWVDNAGPNRVEWVNANAAWKIKS